MKTEAEAAAYIEGKTIAFVANSTLGIERTHGWAIDAHDIVLRMNAGVPGPDLYKALGSRTDVLAIGTRRSLMESLLALSGTSGTHVWWVKGKTKMGEKEYYRLEELFEEAKPSSIATLWKFPVEWAEEAWEACGTPPSGGIIVLRALEHLGAKRISIFNMDFFGALAGDESSWWHAARPNALVSKTRPHVGEAELKLVRDMGFTEKEDGLWVK